MFKRFGCYEMPQTPPAPQDVCSPLIVFPSLLDSEFFSLQGVGER